MAIGLTTFSQVGGTTEYSSSPAQTIKVPIICGTSSGFNPYYGIPKGAQVKSYLTLAQVLEDFPDTTPEYVASSQFLGMNRNGLIPNVFLIGRYYDSSYSSEIFTQGDQSTSSTSWSLITNGSFVLTTGSTAHDVVGLNFTPTLGLQGDALMQTIASIVTAGMQLVSGLSGAHLGWSVGFQNFVLDTGILLGALGYLTPLGTGTDISSLLGMASSQGAIITQAGGASTGSGALSTLFDAAQNSKYVKNGLFPFDAAMFTKAVTALGSTFINSAVGWVSSMKNVSTVYLFLTDDEISSLSGGTNTILYSLIGNNLLQFQFDGLGQQTAVAVTVGALCNRDSEVSAAQYMNSNQSFGVNNLIPTNLTSAQFSSLKAQNCGAFCTLNFTLPQTGQSSILYTPTFMDGVQAQNKALALQVAKFVRITLGYAVASGTTRISQEGIQSNIVIPIQNYLQSLFDKGILVAGTWVLPSNLAASKGQYLSSGFSIAAEVPASGSVLSGVTVDLIGSDNFDSANGQVVVQVPTPTF